MFSIAFSSLFGQNAARGISGEPYLRATSTRYSPLPGPPLSLHASIWGAPVLGIGRLPTRVSN
jgi:hypothetical protein